MTKFRVFSLMVIALCCICILNPLPRSQASADLKHQIVGYGPSYGDLVFPSSMTLLNGEAIILDQQGLQVFDSKTQEFLRCIPLPFSIENPIDGDATLNLVDQNYPLDFWKKSFNSFSSSFRIFLPPQWHEGFYLFLFECGYLRSIKHDSQGLIYLLDYQQIIVLDPVQGKIARLIDLKELLRPQEHDISQVVFTLVGDRIHLYAQSRDKHDRTPTSCNIYTLNLEGEVLRSIALPFSLFRHHTASQMIYLPDLQIFGFVQNPSLFNRKDASRLLFFDIQGNPIKTIANLKELNHPLMAFKDEGSLTLYNEGKLIQTQYHLDEAKQLHLTPISEEVLAIPGLVFDMVLGDEYIGLIIQDLSRKDWVNELANSFQVMLKKEHSLASLGTSPNRSEQLYGSKAFCINKAGDLLVSNAAQEEFSVFNSRGDQTSSIASSDDFGMRGIHDMIYHQDKLYAAFSESLYQYDSDTQEWKALGYNLSSTYHRMVSYDNNLYISNAVGSFDPAKPQLYLINSDGTPETLWFQKACGLSEERPPLLLDFVITEEGIVLFLDSEYHRIYRYDLYTQEYLSSIILPQENSFYTSLSLLPDGSLLLCDVIQSCLWHLDEKVQVIKRIGQKGRIATPNSKENYQQKTTDFFVPFQAKVKNGNIYVNDLFNCRYHIIAIE
jgi:hypothetical protein